MRRARVAKTGKSKTQITKTKLQACKFRTVI